MVSYPPKAPFTSLTQRALPDPTPFPGALLRDPGSHSYTIFTAVGSVRSASLILPSVLLWSDTNCLGSRQCPGPSLSMHRFQTMSLVDHQASDAEEGFIQVSDLDSNVLSLPSPDNAVGDQCPILQTGDMRFHSEQLISMTWSSGYSLNRSEGLKCDPKSPL